MKIFTEIASRLRVKGCQLVTLYIEKCTGYPNVAGINSMLVIRGSDGLYYAAHLGWSFTAGANCQLVLSRFTDSLDRVKSWKSPRGAVNAIEKVIKRHEHNAATKGSKCRKIEWQIIAA